MTRLVIRFLAFLILGKHWPAFLDIANQVSNDPRIPIYGSDQIRYGREARRDEAAHRLSNLGMKDSQVNLGCELAHWWRKLGNR
jgi:hypothetical protein